MITVKTRGNSNDGYDVAFLSCDLDETIALRNALSDVTLNREWAKKKEGTIMAAIRENPVMTQVHTDFKRNERDAPVIPEDEDFDGDDEEVSHDGGLGGGWL